MYPEVSTVVPGASSPEQIEANARASELPAFSDGEMDIVKQIYNKYIREKIHSNW